MGAAEFEIAGLYDPAAPNAAERLELLEWLAARGVSIERMVQAVRGRASLSGLAGDLVLRPADSIGCAEVARRAGLAPEQVQAIRLAAGLPPVTPDDATFSSEDARGFAAFATAAELFGEQAIWRFLRVIGSALDRIAEGAVALFLVNIEAPFRERKASELALAQANLRAVESLAVIPDVIHGLFLGHMQTAIRRLREAKKDGASDTVNLAIGFVDLVGFTPLSRTVGMRALAEVVERFEETAHDVATSRDGRVVKLIGDEVMFAAVSPAAACDIALTLVERLCCGVPVTPRGGLAYGEVLLRGGDYYGPVVNLAARIAELAVPNELLVTPEVAHGAGAAGLRFEPAGKRMPKGFDAPVSLMTLERA